MGTRDLQTIVPRVEGLKATCVNQHGVKEGVYVIRGYVKGCNHIHRWAGK